MWINGYLCCINFTAMCPKICFRHVCFSIFLIFLSLDGAKAQHRFKVMEWNVENLFDTLHDAHKSDWDFTPDGAYKWRPWRYWRKLDAVAKTIAAVGGETGLPALVGMCEVENDSVMCDLTHRSALRAAGYAYVMTQSADVRGIDVVLLYQPFLFRLLSWHAIRVPSRQHGFSPTRDLLYASGCLPSGDTLHVVVCHFPSKTGGARESESHRRLTAKSLRTIVDSVLLVSPQAKMLVMGDYNASFHEKLFRQLCPPLVETLPTSRRALMQPVGSYYFQRKWSYLDHILVSEGLLSWQKTMQTACSAQEVHLPFLLDREGVPNRTFKGTFYHGGISDHLPLVIELCY